MTIERCAWANPTNPLYLRYHDEEWGVPCHNEIQLFEMLNLEGAQAGLSWETILNKREGYRNAFAGWNAEAIARFDETDRARLLADAGIVRNRLKIDATIGNAQAYLRMRERGETLDAWLWRFVDGRPIQSNLGSGKETPAQTALSETISKELKKMGFRFVGPTIIYAWMQATGLVNDHPVTCFRHAHLKESNS
ncbi:DNA-3-methyladenine glycosylase I [Burkholderiaceae bacterium DAT-1]|nr:DNA-3-methyladenine glycosylase I [Burkholderiaceae bacterium DAT-1]